MNDDGLRPFKPRHEDRFAVSDQDKLEELMKFIPSKTDKIVAINAIRTLRQQHKRTLCIKGYVTGVLKKMVYCKSFFDTSKPIIKHIEMLHFLGYSEAEIMLTLFEFGYRQITATQVGTYLRLVGTRVRLEKLKEEYEMEISLLKSNAFQQLAGVVIDEEKKYLHILLAKLPALYAELEETDPDKEPARWNRLDKTITGILDKCKGMHGIDLYREYTVKTAGAIAVQQAAGTKKEDDYRLPMPSRPMELTDNKIIEMEPQRMVIKQKEHEL